MDLNINEPKHCLGLENNGATCYMNATIQCLCNVYDLRLQAYENSRIYKERQKHWHDSRLKER